MKQVHVISRNQARSIGMKRFFTGVPCRHGHISERVVSSSSCLSCDAEKSARYRVENPESARRSVRESYAKNREKRAETNRIYIERNIESIRKRKEEYRKENQEKIKYAKHKYYVENKEKVLEAGKVWYRENKGRARKNREKWASENRERIRTLNRNRKARQRSAKGRHYQRDIEKIMHMQRGRCAHCAVDVKNDYHVDHVVALKNGGSNWPENLQILCPGCNMSKGAKDEIEWAQSRGKLL